MELVTPNLVEAESAGAAWRNRFNEHYSRMGNVAKRDPPLLVLVGFPSLGREMQPKTYRYLRHIGIQMTSGCDCTRLNCRKQSQLLD